MYKSFFEISVKFISLFKNLFTKQSFALTIIVSNKESLFVNLLIILINGYLIELTFLSSKLFKISKFKLLDLIL